MNELFAEPDVVRRMLVIGIDSKAGFDKTIGRESAIERLLLKRIEGMEMSVEDRIP